MSDDYTQAARAEAERHYPALNADDETLTYPRSAVREHARGGFVKGYEAGWAAGRAETPAGLTVSEDGAVLNWRGVNYVPQRAETTTACTCDAAPAEIGGASHRPGCGEAETPTATVEDIQTLDARWFERWETEQPLADKYAGYYQGRVSAVAQCREELRRLLATARTRPTREQIIDALVMSPLSDTAGTDLRPFEQTADVVLALLADQPDPADVWDQAADRIEIDGGRESAITDHLREVNPYRRERAARIRGGGDQ